MSANMNEIYAMDSDAFVGESVILDEEFDAIDDVYVWENTDFVDA